VPVKIIMAKNVSKVYKAAKRARAFCRKKKLEIAEDRGED
jgi:hypothetical protein